MKKHSHRNSAHQLLIEGFLDTAIESGYCTSSAFTLNSISSSRGESTNAICRKLHLNAKKSIAEGWQALELYHKCNADLYDVMMSVSAIKTAQPQWVIELRSRITNFAVDVCILALEFIQFVMLLEYC